jgi:radical SAM superfamily enzyme YgiQ (UPF0313 family)
MQWLGFYDNRKLAAARERYNGRAVKIVLISTYELGRQPFGLASPAAWLRGRGHAVTCLDLSREPLNEQAVGEAQLIAFYVPMHTATRLTLELLEPVRRMQPKAHLCAYGLYASLSAESFRAHGVNSLLGGEFEQSLVDRAEHLEGLSASPKIHPLDTGVSLARLRFQKPDREGLPPLRSYAHLVLPSGEHRTVGYTEASRGCKHLCRHCPIVPVYNGVFRIVDREVVLADIRQQVAAGAQHITFGDPDFFNGVGHAIPLVEALHREFPALTYDVTIKVEHLLQNVELLRTLRQTGCLFVISAVESLDDGILQKLQKDHTRADFFRVVEECRQAAIILQPTFVPFTPWTTYENYLDLFENLRRLNLVEAVAPIQLAIRLLIPSGSRLLEIPEARGMVGPFDARALVYPWKNPNPALDRLAEEAQDIVAASEKMKRSRMATFEQLWRAANHAAGVKTEESAMPILAARATVPYLNEPWYC